MPSILTLRLDWSEMDLFGHINNVSYFKYIQASRVHYWETIGLTQLHSNMQVGPILASTCCEFKKPLQYPGEIRIEATIEFIKNSSFGIVHRIFDKESQLAALAKDIVVTYDFEKNTPIPIPQQIRVAIERLEEKQF